MSSSPSQKTIRAGGLWTTTQQAYFGQMSALPEVAVAASTHQNGWSQEGHPEGYFNVFLSRLYLTGSLPTTCCASEDASMCPS